MAKEFFEKNKMTIVGILGAVVFVAIVVFVIIAARRPPVEPPEPPVPPQFTITDLTVTPETVVVGGDVVITFTATNATEAEMTRAIEIRKTYPAEPIVGVPPAEPIVLHTIPDVTLAAGASRELTHTWTTAEVGTFIISVLDQTATVVVTEPEPDPIPPLELEVSIDVLPFFDAGEEVIAVIGIYNPADEPLVGDFDVLLNRDFITAIFVELRPGEVFFEEVIIFAEGESTPGMYTVMVGDERATFEVEEPPVLPELEVVEIILGNPDNVFYEGDRITATVIIRNRHAEPLSGEFPVLLNDEEIYVISVVNLAPGEEYTAEVVVFEEATLGQFILQVGAITAEFEVLPAPEPVIALSPVTPAAVTVPLYAQMAPLLKVDITAGAEALTITEMRFRRTGVGKHGDWVDLHLFEGGLRRLTPFGKSIDPETHEVRFLLLDINVPAKETRTITLKADATGAIAEAGNESIFELVYVSGFPPLNIRGNKMTIGRLAVSAVTVASGITLPNPMVGTPNAKIASFTISAGDRTITLRQLAVEVGGTIRAGDASNFKLYHGATRLAEVEAIDAYDRAIFALPVAFEIGRGRTETFVIRADLIGRAGKTIITKITTDEDIVAIDGFIGGFGALVRGIPVELERLTLEGATLTLVDEGPRAANVARGTDNVELIKVRMTAERDLEVRPGAIVLNFDGTVTADNITNLRLRDAAPGGAILMTGEIVGTAAMSAGAYDAIALSGSFTLTAGIPRSVIVTVDVDADVPDRQNIRVDRLTVRYALIRDIGIGAPLLSVDLMPPFVVGELMTIVAAGLTTFIIPHPLPPTVVTGVENVPTMGFRLRADDAAIVVRAIDAQFFAHTVTPIPDIAATRALPRDVVISARLMHGATVLATSTLTPTGLAEFRGFNLSIPADGSEDLVIQISAAPGLIVSHFVAITIDTDRMDVVDINGVIVPDLKRTTLPGDDVLNPARTLFATITPAGLLTVALDPASPVSAIIPVGLFRVDNVALTRLDLRTVREPIIIEEITVRNVVAGVITPTTAPLFIELWAVGGAAPIASEILIGGVAEFRALNIRVPLAGKDLFVKADLAGIGLGSVSGDTVQLNAHVMRASGAHSGASLAVPIPGIIPAVAATATATVTDPVATLDLALNIDGVAITLAPGDTAGAIADKIAAAIMAPAVEAITTVNVTRTAAVGLVFTNEVPGVIGNRTVAYLDRVYSGGEIPVITMSGGLNATDQISTVTLGPGDPAEAGDVFRVIIDGHEMAVTGHTTTIAAAAALQTFIHARPRVSATVVGRVITITADDTGVAVADAFTISVSVVDTGVTVNTIGVVTTAAVPAVAATSPTITVPAGVTALDLALSIDGAAIILTHGMTPAEVATAIRTAVNAVRTPARTVHVGGIGATLIFTNEFAPIHVGRTVDRADPTYTGGVAPAHAVITIPSITLTDGAVAVPATPVLGHPMTIRQTVPTVAKLANDTVLAGAPGDEILRFTVAANAAGDVTLSQVRVTKAIFTSPGTPTATLTLDRLIQIFDGVAIVGTATMTTDLVLGSNTFTTLVPVSPDLVIAAGTSRTLVVRFDTTGLTTVGDRVTASIVADDAADTAGAIDFAWRDVAAGPFINGFLVPGFPVAGDTLIR